MRRGGALGVGRRPRLRVAQLLEQRELVVVQVGYDRLPLRVELYDFAELELDRPSRRGQLTERPVVGPTSRKLSDRSTASVDIRHTLDPRVGHHLDPSIDECPELRATAKLDAASVIAVNAVLGNELLESCKVPAVEGFIRFLEGVYVRCHGPPPVDRTSINDTNKISQIVRALAYPAAADDGCPRPGAALMAWPGRRTRAWLQDEETITGGGAAAAPDDGSPAPADQASGAAPADLAVAAPT
jgi:hypothetical protein